MPSLVKYALITGASSGIGEAIAKEMATPGMHLGLVARRLDRLQSVAAICRQRGALVSLFPCDLADDEQRSAMINSLNETWPQWDILVNSAGFGWYGNLSEMPWETAQQMISVHNIASTHLTMAAIDAMCETGSGVIININSIISDLHVQGSVLYAATKSYEHAFSVAADRELRQQGIRVCCLKPGPVKTPFFDVSSKQHNGHRIPGERFAITAEQVARSVVRLIGHPRQQVYLPWYYFFIPLVEQCFGWAINLAGPVILQAQKPRS